mmetsp:Transcript_50088/g.150766  ORF Transcript_50088/g.150766 Transcript_50088/m.150766 type:complete len:256 (-) Transcript_50088:459-1226(-)
MGTTVREWIGTRRWSFGMWCSISSTDWGWRSMRWAGLLAEALPKAAPVVGMGTGRRTSGGPSLSQRTSPCLRRTSTVSWTRRWYGERTDLRGSDCWSPPSHRLFRTSAMSAAPKTSAAAGCWGPRRRRRGSPKYCLTTPSPGSITARGARGRSSSRRIAATTAAFKSAPTARTPSIPGVVAVTAAATRRVIKAHPLLWTNYPHFSDRSWSPGTTSPSRPSPPSPTSSRRRPGGRSLSSSSASPGTTTVSPRGAYR